MDSNDIFKLLDCVGRATARKLPEIVEPLPVCGKTLSNALAAVRQGDCTVTLYSYDSYDSYEEDHVDDVSNDPGNGVMWHNSVFDRYTGNYFRGGSKTKEAIKMGDVYCDVRTAGDSVNEYPIFYITRTLICPVDYGGAVFKFGYTSPELSEQSGKIDFEARVYKVDELPYNGCGCCDYCDRYAIIRQQ